MWKRWRIRILLFLAVLGPGFITANVDNDSGGILTYSQAGAQYGYTLLWTMHSHHHRADRGAGDVRPHGRGHRQGAERPDPRGVRAAAHLCADGAAGGGELHQRGDGVHRHRRLAAPVSRDQVHLRAVLRGRWSGTWWCGATTRARKRSSSSLRWSISATSLPACSRSPAGTMRCWPR